MVTVSTPAERDVISRVPFLNDRLGELVAWHDREGPMIDVRLAPEDSGTSVTATLSPSETRELADQLRQIADVAQHAGWTPAVLADVREHYLPGAGDEEIMARLDQLTHRLDSSPLGIRQGTVHPAAGRMLTADVGSELVEQASAALDDTIDRLTEFRHAIDRPTTLRDSLADLQRFYRTESEKKT